MIHVCFGLYDKTGRYSKFTGTAMLSMFENTMSEITVHILHDNTLTQDNREKFIYLAGRYNQTVKFYNVEELCADKLATFLRLIPFMKSARTSIGTFYKFFIMDVLERNIEKVIYLDADIVVNLDINELWRIELGDKPLGAVPRILQHKDRVAGLIHMKYGFDLTGLGLVKSDDYFNAGVLLMNLKRLRNEEEKILGGMKFRGEHPEFRMFDQCIWNYCFSTEYFKLPTKFNRAVVYVRTEDNGLVENKIYHYTYNNSFWSFGMDMDDGLNRLWMKYFIKSPWFDEISIGRIYANCERNYLRLSAVMKSAMIQVSSIMSGKSRAFLAVPDDIDAFKKIFGIRDDEEIIPAESQEPSDNLIRAMEVSRGKKVFFIMLSDFPFKKLTDAGFESGKDFVNGLEFLPDTQGVPLNSYPIIQEM